MANFRFLLLISLVISIGEPATSGASRQQLHFAMPVADWKMHTFELQSDALMYVGSTASLFGGADDASVGSLFATGSAVSLFGGEDDYSSGRFFANLTAEQEQNIINRAYPRLAAKWDAPNIFVCWETLDDNFADKRALVQAAIKDTWEAASALRFLDWGKCLDDSQGIRIAIADGAPHVVEPFGKFINGVPDGMVLNFNYNIWGKNCKRRAGACDQLTQYTAVHEFGHAIGFAHEQNRPDTPRDCSKVHRAQGEDGDDVEMTPWDPKSIMNYCNPETISDPVLSDFDKFAVKQIYGEA